MPKATTEKTVVTQKSEQKLAIPNHIGFIMDGNRRWAQERGISTLKGHKAGFDMLERVIHHALDKGVRELSFYTFSTENWDRSPEEVKYLMDMFRRTFKKEADRLHKENVRVRLPGLSERVSPDIQKIIKDVEAKTADNTQGIVNFCFNYGGRADILQAVNKLVKAGKPVTQADFSQALSTHGMSDLDLIVRTSEYRLSGFLPWESVYAEIYIAPDLYWPDFDEQELDKALDFFASRQRRFGK